MSVLSPQEPLWSPSLVRWLMYSCITECQPHLSASILGLWKHVPASRSDWTRWCQLHRRNHQCGRRCIPCLNQSKYNDNRFRPIFLQHTLRQSHHQTSTETPYPNDLQHNRVGYAKLRAATDIAKSSIIGRQTLHTTMTHILV